MPSLLTQSVDGRCTSQRPRILVLYLPNSKCWLDATLSLTTIIRGVAVRVALLAMPFTSARYWHNSGSQDVHSPVKASLTLFIGSSRGLRDVFTNGVLVVAQRLCSTQGRINQDLWLFTRLPAHDWKQHWLWLFYRTSIFPSKRNKSIDVRRSGTASEFLWTSALPSPSRVREHRRRQPYMKGIVS